MTCRPQDTGSRWYSPDDLGICADGNGDRDVYLTQLADHERLAERARAIVTAEDPKLWADFEDSLSQLVVIAELAEAIRQGRVIDAALRGDLTAWPGCCPQWHNAPTNA